MRFVFVSGRAGFCFCGFLGFVASPFLSGFMALLSGDQVRMFRVSWGSCAEVVSVLEGFSGLDAWFLLVQFLS